MNVEHKLNEKPLSMDELLKKTFNEGVKVGIRMALKSLEELKVNAEKIMEDQHE